MNTAATCTAIVLPTRRPLLQRWRNSLGEIWAAWRQQARRHAEMRSLEGLSDATLRDIGLAERVFQQPTRSSIDYERGRW